MPSTGVFGRNATLIDGSGGAGGQRPRHAMRGSGVTCDMARDAPRLRYSPRAKSLSTAASVAGAASSPMAALDAGAISTRTRCASVTSTGTADWCSSASSAGAMSVILTNAEKQARYRERHLGVDGEKVHIGLNLNPAPGRNGSPCTP
jgi:hypothetical protein